MTEIQPLSEGKRRFIGRFFLLMVVILPMLFVILPIVVGAILSAITGTENNLIGVMFFAPLMLLWMLFWMFVTVILRFVAPFVR